MYIQEDDLNLNDWQFSQRKNLPYETKLMLTHKRITEWFENWNGDVYVSFSGGLDSTVLLHLVRQHYSEWEVPAVFADTGLEYPELREFVKSIGGVVIIKPKMSFKEVILKYGYPVVSKETAAKVRKLRNGNLSDKYRNYLLNGDERGKLGMLAKKWRILIDAPFESSEKCCDVMKKTPFRQYHKETGRVPYIGVTQDESFMRERQYARTGCNVYDAGKPKSQPLGFWTKQDVLRYVAENNISICSVYGEIKQKADGTYYLTGEQRTGCVFCAFGCHLEQEPNRFQRLEKTHPRIHDYCMRDLDKGGLGMEKVLEYIDVPCYSSECKGQINITDYLLQHTTIQS